MYVYKYYRYLMNIQDHAVRGMGKLSYPLFYLYFLYRISMSQSVTVLFIIRYS